MVFSYYVLLVLQVHLCSDFFKTIFNTLAALYLHSSK